MASPPARLTTAARYCTAAKVMHACVSGVSVDILPIATFELCLAVGLDSAKEIEPSSPEAGSGGESGLNMLFGPVRELAVVDATSLFLWN